jgi:hypothetical protein
MNKPNLKLVKGKKRKPEISKMETWENVKDEQNKELFFERIKKQDKALIDQPEETRPK